VADVLAVVGWFPEARPRCAPPVWRAGDAVPLEGRKHEAELSLYTAQLRQVLEGSPPDLDALPRRWHADAARTCNLRNAWSGHAFLYLSIYLSYASRLQLHASRLQP